MATLKNNSSMITPPHHRSSTTHEAKDGRHPHKVEKVAVSHVVAEGHKQGKNGKLESKPSIDIDQSAELFIQKFRRQLLIQRLESIENYEQMLARGL
ncbi:hypothetical protein Tsubulata_049361 [Turnera subulata]|uniref:Uncharacterized protein n=1 Tax=Turnera subulata TaxID=218843 RepID=A0A9Q0J4U8_9ROSI|nr:hypothetical protein Tsubulata_049361 [Turnera subulata]